MRQRPIAPVRERQGVQLFVDRQMHQRGYMLLRNPQSLIIDLRLARIAQLQQLRHSGRILALRQGHVLTEPHVERGQLQLVAHPRRMHPWGEDQRALVL
jgi:hypothetical protein